MSETLAALAERVRVLEAAAAARHDGTLEEVRRSSALSARALDAAAASRRDAALAVCITAGWSSVAFAGASNELWQSAAGGVTSAPRHVLDELPGVLSFWGSRFVRASRLMRAAAMGNAPRVRALLGHGASANLADDYGRTALHYACENRAVPAAAAADVVSALVHHHAGVNARASWSPPERSEPHPRGVRPPHLQHERDLVDVADVTPLMVAASRCACGAIRELVKAHADVNERDSLGKTAFDYVASSRAAQYAKEEAAAALRGH